MATMVSRTRLRPRNRIQQPGGVHAQRL